MNLAGRAGTVLLMGTLMAGTAYGVYSYLGSHRSARLAERIVKKPTQVQSLVALPGALYFVQGGAIYQLEKRAFKEIAGANGWRDLSPAPGGRLFAVRRGGNFSDLYLLGTDGTVVKQLTHNRSSGVAKNHWVFFPRLAPDEKTVWFSYDQPKGANYLIDFAIWNMPVNGTIAQAHQWTIPFNYTGGDVYPIPLGPSKFLYVRYDLDEQSRPFSQIDIATRPNVFGTPLTPAAQNCAQPALSPSRDQVVMICSPGHEQTNHLAIATFNGSKLGPLRVLESGQLMAQPVWAPDGSGVVYFSPESTGGPFQLWWLPIQDGGPAGAPRLVAKNLAVDAGAMPSWLS